jgi:hypothetical protein
MYYAIQAQFIDLLLNFHQDEGNFSYVSFNKTWRTVRYF